MIPGFWYMQFVRLFGYFADVRKSPPSNFGVTWIGVGMAGVWPTLTSLGAQGIGRI